MSDILIYSRLEPKHSVVIIPPKTDINLPIALEYFRIDPTKDIAEPPVYCYIGNSPAMTAGNFSLIIGKAKSGKTFFLGSVVAALMSNTTLLGVIRGCLPGDKKTVLYFDTEQSEFHATRTVKRICKLAGNESTVNLIAYGLRPLIPTERLIAIEEKIQTTDNLGAVVIDGIRDLLTMGINDEAEATMLTSKFLKWTAEYQMHMILLLHQNKTDFNARGHIGTEVLNKAETTLAVTKDEKTGTFVVLCDYSRDIGFEDFGFNIVDGLPVASELPHKGQSKSKKPQDISDEDHLEKLNIIFHDNRKKGREELHEAIQYHYGVGVIRSREFVYHYNAKGWIDKERLSRNVSYVYKRAIF